MALRINIHSSIWFRVTLSTKSNQIRANRTEPEGSRRKTGDHAGSRQTTMWNTIDASFAGRDPPAAILLTPVIV
jgi:hypothetical protein